ncbi:peptidoglycan recognition family protein [Blautia sp. CLA-JM-H16]|uniref:N-acetylmuramoyl-L-alanine amidase n=2 Tax=Blautia aquisgranensis TaxID=3133153 RepID=A0ABV1BFX1_9FIRM
MQRMVLILIVVIVAVAVCAVGYGFFEMRLEQNELNAGQNDGSSGDNESSGPEQWQKEGAPYIDVELLTPNPYSRPQLPIEQVNYIAIHYTANPGSTAMSNRDYFENLATTQENKVSSHFVVGLEGEVVQCIPTSEMSYATNSRNVDTISIECCHPDETGQFNDATYSSAVKLTAWLCTRFGLGTDQVIRHYDVTGKDCPKYYVENPDAWIQMKEDIAAQIQEDYALQGK